LSSSEVFLAEAKGGVDPILLIAIQGPRGAEGNKEVYAAQVFHSLLDLRSSPYQQNLVESGLARKASSHYKRWVGLGSIEFRLELNSQRVPEALRIFEMELASLSKPDYFTDVQLAAAKKRLLMERTYEHESMVRYTEDLLMAWTREGLTDFMNYEARIEGVAREDVQKYVTNYLKGKQNVAGLSLPENIKSTLGAKPLQPFRI